MAPSPTLIVPASTAANTVAELVSAFRSKGGKINYGVSGAGGAMHLITENFRLLNGFDMQAIVYKGGGPAVAAVVSGEVPMSFESLGSEARASFTLLRRSIQPRTSAAIASWMPMRA